MTDKTMNRLEESLAPLLGDTLNSHHSGLGELTLEIDSNRIRDCCLLLRDQAGFDQLTDLCGVDYAGYGADGGDPWTGERFAVVYHLISYTSNTRIRLRAQLRESNPSIDSVIDIWPAADWFEREAFDLFGIIFHGHPDLRRILTDYGFIGHPFRKDFPLSGQVEMRFDEEQGRVIYQPVTIDPRILVPRTIRKDVFGKGDEKPEQTSAAEESA
jgi:NADH-quinone oxidoreductase subunit C